MDRNFHINPSLPVLRQMYACCYNEKVSISSLRFFVSVETNDLNDPRDSSQLIAIYNVIFKGFRRL